MTEPTTEPFTEPFTEPLTEPLTEPRTEPLPAPLWSDATELCRDLQQGSVTATAVMDNVYTRIAALNPALNALVSLIPKEQAMTLAAAADASDGEWQRKRMLF